MPTRADIEAATPRCQGLHQQRGAPHPNCGRHGGLIRSVTERLCLKPMRFHATDCTWVCECGATQSGAFLGA